MLLAWPVSGADDQPGYYLIHNVRLSVSCLLPCRRVNFQPTWKRWKTGNNVDGFFSSATSSFVIVHSIWPLHHWRLATPFSLPSTAIIDTCTRKRFVSLLFSLFLLLAATSTLFILLLINNTQQSDQFGWCCCCCRLFWSFSDRTECFSVC